MNTEKMDFNLDLALCINVNSKWTVDYSGKLLDFGKKKKKNMEESLQDLGLGREFLLLTTKCKVSKRKS